MTLTLYLDMVLVFIILAISSLGCSLFQYCIAPSLQNIFLGYFLLKTENRQPKTLVFNW